jgi:hypothetical protein
MSYKFVFLVVPVGVRIVVLVKAGRYAVGFYQQIEQQWRNRARH